MEKIDLVKSNCCDGVIFKTSRLSQCFDLLANHKTEHFLTTCAYNNYYLSSNFKLFYFSKKCKNRKDI